MEKRVHETKRGIGLLYHHCRTGLPSRDSLVRIETDLRIPLKQKRITQAEFQALLLPTKP